MDPKLRQTKSSGQNKVRNYYVGKVKKISNNLAIRKNTKVTGMGAINKFVIFFLFKYEYLQYVLH